MTLNRVEIDLHSDVKMSPWLILDDQLLTSSLKNKIWEYLWSKIDDRLYFQVRVIIEDRVTDETR